MSLFKSVFGLVEDVVTIAAKPVEIAVDLARTATQPIADAAKDAARAVKEETGVDEKKGG